MNFGLRNSDCRLGRTGSAATYYLLLTTYYLPKTKKVTCSQNKSPFPVLLFNYGWRSGEIGVVDKIHFNRTD